MRRFLFIFNLKNMTNKIDKIISLSKRRGFIYPNSEIYGGLANAYDFGPLGTELKNNVKQLWWKFFVQSRSDMFGVDAALIMSRKVWQASGHEKKFTDLMADCKKCKNRFRADKLKDLLKDLSQFEYYKGRQQDLQEFLTFKRCPRCGGELTEPRQFNTMLKTYIGPVEDEAGLTYLRPETAQGMFVNFKNIIDSFHPKLPFGLAQIGKAFRNEITPGNFIFRTREFEQMEIEYFIQESEWEARFENWLSEMKKWMKLIGLSEENLVFREVPAEERAHYSKRTVDIDYKFPFGEDELYGLAYRGDFDLKNHSEASGVDLSYQTETGEKFLPHVIEPTFGVERTVLAILSESYREETDEKGKTRAVLKLPFNLAPVKVAVFPLVANKENIVGKASEIYDSLKPFFAVRFDDIGNIGKRYRRQDEIGTPFCVTVDYQTLEDQTVTVRDRDTMKQERVAISELNNHLIQKLNF